VAGTGPSGPPDVHPHLHVHPHPLRDAAGHVSVHNPGAGQGPVVLDIGGDVGALVVHAPADMVGEELHLSPSHDDTDRRHVEVLPRHLTGGVRYAAVFGSVTAGRWTLRDGDGSPTSVVDVHGGQVTEVVWGQALPPRP